MQFTQHIVFYASDEEAVRSLVADWKADGPPAPGFLSGRLLRFRDKPGRYVLQSDFDSFESAEASQNRPETKTAMENLLALVEGEPKYENLDILSDY